MRLMVAFLRGVILAIPLRTSVQCRFHEGASKSTVDLSVAGKRIGNIRCILGFRQLISQNHQHQNRMKSPKPLHTGKVKQGELSHEERFGSSVQACIQECISRQSSCWGVIVTAAESTSHDQSDSPGARGLEPYCSLIKNTWQLLKARKGHHQHQTVFVKDESGEICQGKEGKAETSDKVKQIENNEGNQNNRKSLTQTAENEPRSKKSVKADQSLTKFSGKPLKGTDLNRPKVEQTKKLSPVMPKLLQPKVNPKNMKSKLKDSKEEAQKQLRKVISQAAEPSSQQDSFQFIKEDKEKEAEQRKGPKGQRFKRSILSELSSVKQDNINANENDDNNNGNNIKNINKTISSSKDGTLTSFTVSTERPSNMSRSIKKRWVNLGTASLLMEGFLHGQFYLNNRIRTEADVNNLFARLAVAKKAMINELKKGKRPLSPSQTRKTVGRVGHAALLSAIGAMGAMGAMGIAYGGGLSNEQTRGGQSDGLNTVNPKIASDLIVSRLQKTNIDPRLRQMIDENPNMVTDTIQLELNQFDGQTLLHVLQNPDWITRTMKPELRNIDDTLLKIIEERPETVANIILSTFRKVSRKERADILANLGEIVEEILYNSLSAKWKAHEMIESKAKQIVNIILMKLNLLKGESFEMTKEASVPDTVFKMKQTERSERPQDTVNVIIPSSLESHRDIDRRARDLLEAIHFKMNQSDGSGSQQDAVDAIMASLDPTDNAVFKMKQSERSESPQDAADTIMVSLERTDTKKKASSMTNKNQAVISMPTLKSAEEKILKNMGKKPNEMEKILWPVLTTLDDALFKLNENLHDVANMIFTALKKANNIDDRVQKIMEEDPNGIVNIVMSILRNAEKKVVEDISRNPKEVEKILQPVLETIDDAILEIDQSRARSRDSCIKQVIGSSGNKSKIDDSHLVKKTSEVDQEINANNVDSGSLKQIAHLILSALKKSDEVDGRVRQTIEKHMKEVFNIILSELKHVDGKILQQIIDDPREAAQLMVPVLETIDDFLLEMVDKSPKTVVDTLLTHIRHLANDGPISKLKAVIGKMVHELLYGLTNAGGEKDLDMIHDRIQLISSTITKLGLTDYQQTMKSMEKNPTQTARRILEELEDMNMIDDRVQSLMNARREVVINIVQSEMNHVESRVLEKVIRNPKKAAKLMISVLKTIDDSLVKMIDEKSSAEIVQAILSHMEEENFNLGELAEKAESIVFDVLTAFTADENDMETVRSRASDIVPLIRSEAGRVTRKRSKFKSIPRPSPPARVDDHKSSVHIARRILEELEDIDIIDDRVQSLIKSRQEVMINIVKSELKHVELEILQKIIRNPKEAAKLMIPTLKTIDDTLVKMLVEKSSAEISRAILSYAEEGDFDLGELAEKAESIVLDVLTAFTADENDIDTVRSRASDIVPLIRSEARRVSRKKFKIKPITRTPPPAPVDGGKSPVHIARRIIEELENIDMIDDRVQSLIKSRQKVVIHIVQSELKHVELEILQKIIRNPKEVAKLMIPALKTIDDTLAKLLVEKSSAEISRTILSYAEEGDFDLGELAEKAESIVLDVLTAFTADENDMDTVRSRASDIVPLIRSEAERASRKKFKIKPITRPPPPAPVDGGKSPVHIDRRIIEELENIDMIDDRVQSLIKSRQEIVIHIVQSELKHVELEILQKIIRNPKEVAKLMIPALKTIDDTLVKLLVEKSSAEISRTILSYAEEGDFDLGELAEKAESIVLDVLTAFTADENDMDTVRSRASDIVPLIRSEAGRDSRKRFKFKSIHLPSPPARVDDDVDDESIESHDNNLKVLETLLQSNQQELANVNRNINQLKELLKSEEENEEGSRLAKVDVAAIPNNGFRWIIADQANKARSSRLHSEYLTARNEFTNRLLLLQNDVEETLRSQFTKLQIFLEVVADNKSVREA